MSYLETYQEWLHGPALSPAEKTELESIANDPKEIESRFFDQLSFGTAGLRGTMCTGLHQMGTSTSSVILPKPLQKWSRRKGLPPAQRA